MFYEIKNIIYEYYKNTSNLLYLTESEELFDESELYNNDDHYEE